MLNSLKANIPIILLILFEAAVGILLLVNPETFTRAIIIFFGIILLAIGLIYLIRYLRQKKENILDPVALVVAIVALAIGAVCTFCSGAIINLILAIAIIYGVILLLSGIYKLQNFFLVRKAGLPISIVSAASGVVAVVLGIVVMIYPKDVAISVWQVAGIMLILEAIIDFLSIIQVVRTKRDLKAKSK